MTAGYDGLQNRTEMTISSDTSPVTDGEAEFLTEIFTQFAVSQGMFVYKESA
jgi:hypothetical protein